MAPRGFFASSSLPRPCALFAVGLLAALALLPGRLWAQEDWFRTGTGLGVERVRLAVPVFAARSGEVRRAGEVFHRVLRNDLQVSGIIELVSPSFHPLQVPTAPAELVPGDWAEPPTRARMVAYGNLALEEGRLLVNAWLSDVRNPEAAPVLIRRYRADLTEEQARDLAHRFADEIVERLSGGIPGIAQTRLAFVSNRSGNKEIWVMDYDGHDQRQVTRCGFICLTPRWSPDSTRLAYTVYERRAGSPQVPRTSIQLYSLSMNRPMAFPYLGGTTTTPAWSPDGTHLALSSSRTGDQEVYVVASDGGRLRRLTFSPGVDISPAWNPRTGDQLAFVSDRGGSPQIYLMDSDGANLERLTDGEGYAVSPAWSPNGQMIAFAWQRDEQNFHIFVMDVATRRTVQLTSGEHRNEQPSWAPDGRHLVFQSSRSGRNQIWMMLADGSGLRQLTFEGSNTAPHWSPAAR